MGAEPAALRAANRLLSQAQRWAVTWQLDQPLLAARGATGERWGGAWRLRGERKRVCAQERLRPLKPERPRTLHWKAFTGKMPIDALWLQSGELDHREDGALINKNPCLSQ